MRIVKEMTEISSDNVACLANHCLFAGAPSVEALGDFKLCSKQEI